MNMPRRNSHPSAPIMLACVALMTTEPRAAPYIEPTAVASGMVPKLDPSKLSNPTKLCGWWDNLTPGNVWLNDRSGQWTVALQGMYEASGDGPPFTANQLLPKGAPHGHGCACITARVDRASKFVYSFTNAKAFAPSVCRADPGLEKSGFK
jgi:Protein of unknown function (DUF4087)